MSTGCAGRFGERATGTQKAVNIRMWDTYLGNGLAAFARVGRLLLKRIASDERGQTLAEYGILVTVIAIVVVAVAVLIGHDIASDFNSVVGFL